MFDAVDPANIPADRDGMPALRITVLADRAGEAFDVEGGNAPAAEVAAAMLARMDEAKWSIGYVNESTFHELTAAMGPKGLRWADAKAWPAAGVYLWAADPDGLIAKGEWPLPVTPLAVQDRYAGSYDESVTADNFPAGAAGYIDGDRSAWPAGAWSRFATLEGGGTAVPAPPVPPAPPVSPPPQGGSCTVLLPVLQEGSQGPAVRAVQRLVGGVAADGVFGPLTKAGVEGFQSREHLQVDGVVGAHTWGALLGAPQ